MIEREKDTLRFATLYNPNMYVIHMEAEIQCKLKHSTAFATHILKIN